MKRKASVFLVLFLFFLSIYAAIAFYATTPKPSQPFIGFGIYSHEGQLLGYTGPNSTVVLNQPNEWRLNVTNKMGSLQFVQVISRLGNQTTIPPNATSPASLPVLANSTMFVPNQNTSLLSFNWTITAVTPSGGLDYLTIDLNGHSLNSTLGSPAGSPYRFLFEIWTFNTSLDRFQYYTWLQIWFNVRN
jgi:hypothetical protein